MCEAAVRDSAVRAVGGRADDGARAFARACAGGEGRPVRIRLPTGGLARCRLAATFCSRLKGLLGTDADEVGRDVLLITHCASIHTCGMAYAIDVAFLDKRGSVLAAHAALAPGCVRSCPGAVAVLERVAVATPWFGAGDRPFLLDAAPADEV